MVAYKGKSISYGCTVSLKSMKNSHCDVVSVFETQKLLSLFAIVGDTIYENLVRMLYANLFVDDKDDLEFMVLGTCIILDYYQFENIFSTKFLGYSFFVQHSWPDDIKVSFEDAKSVLSKNPLI